MSRRISGRGLAVVGGIVGLGVFVVSLRAIDVTTLLHMVRRIGAAFLWVLLLAGVRLTARAAAWTSCVGGRSRLPFRAALAAVIVGEGAGNLTPLGPVASEPAKVLWVRRYVGTVEGAASLTVETVIYSITVALMLMGGGLAWAAAFTPARQMLAVGLCVAGAVVLAAATNALRRSNVSGLSRVLGRLVARANEGTRIRAMTAWSIRTRQMLGQLLSREPRTLVTVFALEMSLQAAAVAEVWVTLVLLGVPVTFLQALLLEFANRVVTLVFKFVPLRLGVDELGSGAMASLLGSSGTVGVAVALVRKARVVCWSAVGLALLGARALTAAQELESAVTSGQRGNSVTA
ncbi:MAG: flippase-like domain-containing protein [Gemmatimonadales bacterium]|nr:flippase-like domain-containing protein [Gemmatimonadales bacterium]